MTIHDFDMARFFLGDIVEVQATGANLIEPGDRRGRRHRRGRDRAARAPTARCPHHQHPPLRVRLRPADRSFRREGHASAGNQLPTSVAASGAECRGGAPTYNFFLERYAPAYRAELDHFVTASSGHPPSPGFADGRAALVLADAADESLRTGATARLG